MKVSKAIVNDRRIKIMRQIEEKRSVSVDELVENIMYHRLQFVGICSIGRIKARLSETTAEHH